MDRSSPWLSLMRPYPAITAIGAAAASLGVAWPRVLYMRQG